VKIYLFVCTSCLAMGELNDALRMNGVQNPIVFVDEGRQNGILLMPTNCWIRDEVLGVETVGEDMSESSMAVLVLCTSTAKFLSALSLLDRRF
jgi:hypothetical protein